MEIAIKDLDETYEQEMDSHQDIRVYIEEKVIKKEDEVDYMIDREEEFLKTSKEKKIALVKHIEAEEAAISDQMAELIHKKNKFDQELDKYYDVTRAKQKMDGAIDELKLKLESDNGQQSVDLYNREKNMIVDGENLKTEMGNRIDKLHFEYSKNSKPQIKNVSQIQILQNKAMRKKLDRLDKKGL